MISDEDMSWWTRCKVWAVLLKAVTKGILGFDITRERVKIDEYFDDLPS